MDENLSPTPTRRGRAFLVTVAFVGLVASGPLLLVFGPEVKTRAARPWPEWSTAAFREGRWTEDVRLHLRETSLVTTTFRGVTSEALYIAGMHQPPVVLGRGGTLFSPITLRASRDFSPELTRRRAQFLGEVDAWARARGIRVFCVVVPDKVRALPERVFDSGRLPEPKRSVYEGIVAQLQDAGLETIDLAGAMERWRRERPEEELYHARDTHWSHIGAWRTAREIADRLLELGWLDQVPPAALVATPLQAHAGVHDLTGTFGFLEGGLLARRIRDVGWHPGIQLREGPSLISVGVEQADAGIALCGDSFAAGGLAWSLTAATGRLVDSVGAVPARGPCHGIFVTLQRIADGEIAPAVIIWEIIERSWFYRDWIDAPTLPDR